jgi:hypothetical protein
MTKEQAIEWLKSLNYCDGEETQEVAQAIEMAIKALEQQPSDDCVSRQAVIETIDDCNSDGLKGIFCSYDDGERFKEYIKKLPLVTPTFPKGATNGHMIKAITGEDFSRGASIYNHDLMICEGEYYLAFNIDWWNAQYKGVENG